MNQEKPYIWIARLDYTDPETEAEWNDFYTNVHLDEILSLSGIIRVSRYECVKGRRNNPKYLSITEIADAESLEKFATSPEAIAVGKVLQTKFPKTVGVAVAGYRHIVTKEKGR